jgi:hypothetical protein
MTRHQAPIDLADTIITVRSLIRRSCTTHRPDTRAQRSPLTATNLRGL